MVAIGPDGPAQFARYFREHQLPFRGVADPSGELLAELGQEWRLMAFGRMPAILGYRADGSEAARHLGRSARDLGDFDAVVRAILREPQA